MKTGYGLAMFLVVGASLLSASPTLANVQPEPQFRATPAAVASATFQTAQAKKTACPEGTRWSDGAKMCVKKR